MCITHTWFQPCLAVIQIMLVKHQCITSSTSVTTEHFHVDWKSAWQYLNGSATTWPRPNLTAVKLDFGQTWPRTNLTSAKLDRGQTWLRPNLTAVKLDFNLTSLHCAISVQINKFIFILRLKLDLITIMFQDFVEMMRNIETWLHFP